MAHYSEPASSPSTISIDWTHEYAGCNPARARAAQKAKRRRKVLKFIALALVDVVLTALVTHLLILVLGSGARAAGADRLEETLGAALSTPALPEAPAAEESAGLPEDAAFAAALPFTPVLQNPELPNGCEATSLAALLGYHGFAADKMDLACTWVPRQDFSGIGAGRSGPSPWQAYAGDPATKSGYYCFAPAICQGANAYLAAQGSALACRDISGAAMAEVDALLAAGRPVMLWVTLDYSDTARYMDTGWSLPDGSWYTPYSNLHCVVAHGADAENYYLADPLTGSITMPRAVVEASWRALGSHAAVIE